MRRCGLALLCLVACKTADAPPVSPPSPPVFYEIFVRSFRDTNGDGVGDFNGLTQSLPYLQDLGVGGVWLMPIQPSPSYHGYDVTDFLGVNPAYGTLGEFQHFVDESHARGIKVLMDLVVNHTSDQHPWFTEKPDWYLWRDDDPGWLQPWPGGGAAWREAEDGRFYFGLFSPGMPDLNFRNPAVRGEMARICKTWLDRGVDGFRVDAARHLVESADGVLTDVPETHAYFKSLRKELWKTHPGAPLVAEAWTDRAHMETYRGDGDEFTHAFDFDLAQAVVASLLSGKKTHVEDQLRAIRHWEFEATFLSNHDLDRLVGRLYDEDAVKAAHVILLTLPGTPYLYYGDELLMPNGPHAGDPGKRTPMKWSPEGGFSSATPWEEYAASTDVMTAKADPRSLLQLIRSLIRLRPRLGALRLQDSGHAAVLAYARGDLEVRINLSDEEVTLPAPSDATVVLGSPPGVLPPRAFSIFQSGAHRQPGVRVQGQRVGFSP